MVKTDDMERGIKNKATDPGKGEFPLRLFAAAFAVSLLVTVFSGWQLWRLLYLYEEMSAKHIAITESVGRIMLLDEVLTMSARMAAATGDFNYEKRYDQFDPELVREINAVRNILPQQAIKQFATETDGANTALVAMERQAFALAHRDRRQEAMALLSGDEYLRLKKVYASGMEKTDKAANKLIDNEMRGFRLMSLGVASASATGAFVVLAAWLLAIRAMRNWLAERQAAEEALRNMQNELVRKEKLAMLGQVAGSVGHELRNPLGVMSNAIYYLQSVLVDADKTTLEYLDIVKNEIIVADRIVGDLLDSVRTKPPHPEPVGVAQLVGRILCKYAIPENVSVKLDIPATLPPLCVDDMQIQQVLRNLISNGVEAMTQGGALEIQAIENAAARNITIRVCDSGAGIAPGNLDKVFQPLFTTKARGIGLGLVVVNNLTQANGGSIEVHSEIGKGTVFSITLPAAPEMGYLA